MSTTPSFGQILPFKSLKALNLAEQISLEKKKARRRTYSKASRSKNRDSILSIPSHKSKAVIRSSIKEDFPPSSFVIHVKKGSFLDTEHESKR